LKDVPADLKVIYDIYGNLEDKDYWKVCLNLISELPSHVRVNYQRELKFDEVQTAISNYHALYLPTLNENFGHSIVESLLCGCPVIISDQTPWNDVNNSGAGFAIPLSHKRQFTDAIIEMARLDQAEFSEKSKLANTYISDKIDLKRVKDQYTQMFHDGIKN
jgi:glycosyltransferase involved in cell wall biosynthesis